LLKRFADIYRTRLFTHAWTLSQSWTTINVSWMTGYHNAKFTIQVKETGPVVLVLSQPDDRYYQGLEGQYGFSLQFQLRKIGETSDYVLRARTTNPENCFRSISAEIELEAGDYEVLPKILAFRRGYPPIADRVKVYVDESREKLQRIGLNHDIAHAKAMTETELQELEELQQKAIKRAEKAKKHKKKAEKKEDEKKTEDTEEKKAKKDEEVTQGVESITHGKLPPYLCDMTELISSTGVGTLGVGSVNSDGPDVNTPSTVTEIQEGDQDTAEQIDGEQEGEAQEEGEAKAKTSESDDEDDEEDDGEEIASPWDAVAVIGLRVYSKHPTTVEIVSTKPSEIAALAVDENVPTMPVTV
jgi:hypothetical protein